MIIHVTILVKELLTIISIILLLNSWNFFSLCTPFVHENYAYFFGHELKKKKKDKIMILLGVDIVGCVYATMSFE